MVNPILAKFQIAKQLPTFEQELHQMKPPTQKCTRSGFN